MASLSQAIHGELLVLAASGDQAAWNELVERFISAFTRRESLT